MKITEVFKTEKSVIALSEDIRMHGEISASSPISFLAKMQDLFKVTADTPEEAARDVLTMLLNSHSRTAKVFLNGVLCGARQAGVKIDHYLRLAAERMLDESAESNQLVVEDMNVGGTSELNGVKYDQINGLGAVPYNQDVTYFGHAVLMKPSTFLSLALPIHPSDNSHIINHIKEGKPIGSPWLYLRFGENAEGSRTAEGSYIVGHEGRHRALAVMEVLGDVEMLVHLIYSGCRNRNISEEMLEEVNQGLKAEKGSYKTGPFWKPVG